VAADPLSEAFIVSEAIREQTPFDLLASVRGQHRYYL
jgi:hypothetical protein